MKSMFERLFVAVLFFPKLCFSQDSLYLIGTITGISNAQRITDVKGIGDVNGDGYDDFIVSERTGKTNTDMGIVKLHFGSANVDLIPDVIFHYPGKDSLNDLLDGCGIGDINNDGYNDFALNGSFGDWGRFPKGKSFIYLGGAMIDTVPIAGFYEPWIQDAFYIYTGVGDMNKDGYDDFIARSPYNWTNGKGYVYLFFGGDTISEERIITFTSNILGDTFGASAANIGDMNGDGFDDLAIGAPNLDSGQVYIYYGGNPMDTVPAIVLTGNYLNEGFGGIIKNAGDLNKDNMHDFFIAGGIYVNLYLKRDSILTINGFTLGGGGYINVESNFDINHDGYDDFVIGNTNYRNSDSVMVGGAFVYFGGMNIDGNYKFKLEGENKWDEFSKIMTKADINGDGYDELFIMAPGYPDYNNPCGRIYIFSHKKILKGIDNNESLPINIKLQQNYPNPFNSATNISFTLSTKSFVTLKIYDALGREVATLVSQELPAGTYVRQWDAAGLASGEYFYRLITKNAVMQKKMILLR